MQIHEKYLKMFKPITLATSCVLKNAKYVLVVAVCLPLYMHTSWIKIYIFRINWLSSKTMRTLVHCYALSFTSIEIDDDMLGV